jgi:hypothetical protein
MRARVLLAGALFLMLAIVGLGADAAVAGVGRTSSGAPSAVSVSRHETPTTFEPAASLSRHHRAQRNSARATACPSTHPYRLEVRAETLYELPYIDQIAACTNGLQSQTWISNRSNMVWKPYVTSGFLLTSPLSTAANSLKAAVGYQGQIIVPGSAVVIYAAPARVRWYFDVGMSAAWQARTYLYNWAVNNAISSPAAFNFPLTRVGGAVATCLKAVNAVATTRKNLIADQDVAVSTIIRDVLGSGIAVGTCAQKLKAVATYYRVRVPTYLDLPPKYISYLQSADKLMARMQWAQRYGRALLQLL